MLRVGDGNVHRHIRFDPLHWRRPVTEHPVHHGAIIHDSLGGTHAGSTGMFTWRVGGSISLQDVVAVPGSGDNGLSWGALAQSLDVAMVLDGNGGVIINSDGTQLMDLAYDSNGLVIVQQVLTNGTHSVPRRDSEEKGDSHVLILVTKEDDNPEEDDRPELLSTDDEDSTTTTPPPPPPREEVSP